MYIVQKNDWHPKLHKEFFRVGWVTMVAQNFQMFGEPPQDNPWFVFNGRLKNGDEVDLLRDQPVGLSRPGTSTIANVSAEWKKIHRFLLRFDTHQRFHQALLDYYTQRWNSTHPQAEQVLESRLEAYYERIGPEYQKGDFVRRPDLATWKAPQQEKPSEEELLDDVNSFFKGLEQGPIIPLDEK